MLVLAIVAPATIIASGVFIALMNSRESINSAGSLSLAMKRISPKATAIMAGEVKASIMNLKLLIPDICITP